MFFWCGCRGCRGVNPYPCVPSGEVFRRGCTATKYVHPRTSTKTRYGDPGPSIEQYKGTKSIQSIPGNIIRVPLNSPVQPHVALYACIRSAQFLISFNPIARYDASVTDRWMSTILESSSSCAASVASSSTPCPPQTLESPPGVPRPRHLMRKARANMHSRDTILPRETALPPATTPGACRRRAP